MANKKEIIRDQFITIKVSNEEKELWTNYAKKTGINPTRLARNILMIEAESFYNKHIEDKIFKAYIKYLEITKNEEVLKRIKND